MREESGNPWPVGFCCLNEYGRVEYRDGRPMFVAGTVGNYLHPVALYPHPDPVRAALVEALTHLLSVYSEPDRAMCCDGRECGCMGASVYQEAEHYARDALRAAGEVLS